MKLRLPLPLQNIGLCEWEQGRESALNQSFDSSLPVPFLRASLPNTN